MKADFSGALAFVLKAEGGYSVDPVPTNKGIEQAEYSAWLSANGLPDTSVENITVAQATEIYYDNYWVPGKCNYLPTKTAYVLFNYDVNTGLGRGTMLLQGVLGIPQTGYWSPETSTDFWNWFAKGHTDATLAADIILRANAWYESLAEEVKADMQYLAGWENRDAALQACINAL